MPIVVALTLGSGSCSKTEVVSGYPDEYAGVGLELRIEKGEPVVVRALQGGSGAQAGVLPGDRIVKIDGMNTRGKSLGDIVMRIRGKSGSQISLTLQRDDKRIILVVRRMRMKKGKKDYTAKETG